MRRLSSLGLLMLLAAVDDPTETPESVAKPQPEPTHSASSTKRNRLFLKRHEEAPLLHTGSGRQAGCIATHHRNREAHATVPLLKTRLASPPGVGWPAVCLLQRRRASCRRPPTMM